MITVACVWVRGNVRYDQRYVRRLRNMVARHLRAPHRFVCLTDRPALVADLAEAVEERALLRERAWWTKVRLFDPTIGLTGRVLYLDLDVVVVSDLAPIVDRPSRFALAPTEGDFAGRGGLAVVKMFNSSVMTWDAGDSLVARLWRRFTPAVMDRLWGDQDWIGEQLPDADAMPLRWFPRIGALCGQPPGPDARVVLCKKPKNDVAAETLPWVREAWR